MLYNIITHIYTVKWDNYTPYSKTRNQYNKDIRIKKTVEFINDVMYISLRKQ